MPNPRNRRPSAHDNPHDTAAHSGKRVAIVQSNYLPWKGYFDLINMVDVFVLLDDVQYTTRDWRNRNRIKTPNGTFWLTVPCGNGQHRLICDVVLKESGWQQKHWETILHHYSRAKYWQTYREFFANFYLGRTWSNLSELNQSLIRGISRDILGIKTEFVDSRTFSCTSRKLQLILELLDRMGDVKEYLSGPSARNYLDPAEFERRSIKLTYMDYSGYPVYPQLYCPPFVHEVSIMDLIFNVGPEAPKYMKSFFPRC